MTQAARRRVWVLFGVVVGLMACSPTLIYPEAAVIDCATRADCPEGMICNPNSHRCMTSENPDTQIPALLPPTTVTPAVASLGSEVVVTFTVSETLPVPPTVTFFVAGQAHELTYTSDTGGSQPTFTFGYQPRGDELQGQPLPLRIDMADAFENRFAGELLASVSFDFVSPLVTEPTLRLTPPAGSPLFAADALMAQDLISDLHHATIGTDLRVLFSLSEEVAETSVLVRLSHGSDHYPMTLRGRVGNAFVMGAVVTAAISDAEYDLEIAATDAAGNIGTDIHVAAVTVDTTPPVAPNVAVPGLVSYERTPYGSQATAGTRQFQVVGGADSVEAAAFVLALGGVSANSPVIGATQASVTGDFNLSLPPLDRKTVSLLAVDAAGNAATPAGVRDVRWVGTLGKKIVGSSLENPNRFLVTPRLLATWAQPGAAEVDASAGIDRVECDGGCPADAAVTTVGLGSWRPASTLGDGYAFRPKAGMAVTYDPNTGAILAFGGTDADAPYDYYDVTWAYDGTTWHQVDPPLTGTPPASRPTPRVGAAMVYDENLHRVILFGGAYLTGGAACAGASSFTCNDLWSWDGQQWSPLTATGTPPTHRAYAGIVFDRSRQRTVLHGGRMLLTYRADTVELNCATTPCQWSVAYTSGNPTPARAMQALAYDENNSQIAMFGGVGEAPPCYDAACGDLWQRRGTIWTQVASNTNLYRRGHALVFDAARGELVAFGVDPLFGSQQVADTCGRPWRFDWTSATFDCPASVAAFGTRDVAERPYSYSVYLPREQHMVVFGAQQDGFLHTWDGGARARPAQILELALGVETGADASALVAQFDFHPAAAPVEPGYLSDVGAAYGEQEGFTYGWRDTGRSYSCFGGDGPVIFDANSAASPSQLWDTTFQMVTLAQQASVDCAWELALENGTYLVAVVVGRGPGGTVVAGPQPGTYTLTIEDQTISGVTTADELLQERTVVVTVNDGKLTLLGGDPSGPGSSPTVLAAVTVLRPTFLQEVAVRFDAGGTSSNYDAGQTLTLYAQGGCAGASGATLVFDSDVAPTLPTMLDSLARLVDLNPNRRWEFSVQARDGNAYSGTLSQWSLALNGGTPIVRTPNAVLAAGQGYADAVDLSQATLPAISRVVVTATIANTSYPFCSNGVTMRLFVSPVAGATSDGVALLGFAEQGWESLAQSDASSHAPQSVVWTSHDAVDASRFVYGAARTMRFAVAPLGVNGMLVPGAMVTTDYAEVEIRYRLP